MPLTQLSLRSFLTPDVYSSMPTFKVAIIYCNQIGRKWAASKLVASNCDQIEQLLKVLGDKDIPNILWLFGLPEKRDFRFKASLATFCETFGLLFVPTSGHAVERSSHSNNFDRSLLCSYLCPYLGVTHAQTRTLACNSVTSKKLTNVYKSWSKIISLEKWTILTPIQKLLNNVGDLGKIIVAAGFEKLPKVQ